MRPFETGRDGLGCGQFTAQVGEFFPSLRTRLCLGLTGGGLCGGQFTA
jgi:hypothetical protein